MTIEPAAWASAQDTFRCGARPFLFVKVDWPTDGPAHVVSIGCEHCGAVQRHSPMVDAAWFGSCLAAFVRDHQHPRNQQAERARVRRKGARGPSRRLAKVNG